MSESFFLGVPEPAQADISAFCAWYHETFVGVNETAFLVAINWILHQHGLPPSNLSHNYISEPPEAVQ